MARPSEREGQIAIKEGARLSDAGMSPWESGGERKGEGGREGKM